MIRKTVLAMLFVCGLLTMDLAQSHAQCDCPQLGAVFYGNRVFSPRPPYFAMHPPVYYDRVVSRAYGISPFAVPPGVMPVENSIPVSAKAVSNPFFKGETVDGSSSGDKAGTRTAADRKEIRSKAKSVPNPFYLQKVVDAR